MTLEKLGPVSGSDILVTNGTKTSKEEPADCGEISIATDLVSREPEWFYHAKPSNEPDGILGQFDKKRNIRIYE